MLMVKIFAIAIIIPIVVFTLGRIIKGLIDLKRNTRKDNNNIESFWSKL